jgi:hypothetical protein
MQMKEFNHLKTLNWKHSLNLKEENRIYYATDPSNGWDYVFTVNNPNPLIVTDDEEDTLQCNLTKIQIKNLHTYLLKIF